MMKKSICVSGLVLLISAQALAGNWSHWRGDFGNGVSVDAQPPTEWSDTENIRWKVAIPGRGSGSPIIWEDQVFVVTAMDADEGTDASPEQAPAAEPRRSPFGRRSGEPALKKLRFEVICLDRGTGRVRWQRTATEATPHQAAHSTNSFASASPCTDGQHVYAHFGSRGLYCYTMDGTLVWSRQFGQMETRSSFGEGSSPTLMGNRLIVPWDHEQESYLFALDKLSGEILWKVARDEPSCWATPLMVEQNGQQQIVMNGQNCARGYELETGKELWRCAGQTQRPVASAVAADGLVFVGSGFRGSFLGAFRLDGQGDIEGTSSVKWTIQRDTPDIASPLLSGGRLYFYKGKSGLLSCLDAATGKPHYETERIGLNTIYASPIAAGGHVYLTDRDGTTVVIEDANSLKVVATNSVGETVDATPAPVDKELFLRGERHLFCVAE